MKVRRWLVAGAAVVLGVGCSPMTRPADSSSPTAAEQASAVVLDKDDQAARLDEVVARPLAGMATRERQPVDQPVRLPNQMIIRTGQVSIEVDTLERAVRQVTELAARFGGHVANSSISTGANAPRTATIEVKIAADRYDGTLDGLKQVGIIRSASTNSQDVGEEFVDVTARVTNARRLEDRLLTVLATRTGKLEDVLSVERELARVREEIERYEGRLRYLKAQVAMSTLSVTVFEPGPIVGGPGENVIAAAFREAWRNFVGVVAGAIAIAGGIVPILVLTGLGFLVMRPWLRRARQQPPTG